MITLLLAMLVKERCHNFDCHKIEAYQQKPCRLRYEFDPNARLGESVGQAAIEGETFPMQWFQDAAVRGFVGPNGRNGLSLFFEGRHVRANWLSDTTTMDDDRIQCQL